MLREAMCDREPAEERESLKCERCGERIVNNGFDESECKSAARIQLLCGNEHLERARFSDNSRQALRSAPTCDQSQSRAAMTEDSVNSGEAAIAREREV